MNSPLSLKIVLTTFVIASQLHRVQAYGAGNDYPSHNYRGESSAPAYDPHGSQSLIRHNHPYDYGYGGNIAHHYQAQALEPQENYLEQWLVNNKEHLRNSPVGSEINEEQDHHPQAEFDEEDNDENNIQNFLNLHQAGESSGEEIDPDPYRRNARFITDHYDTYSSPEFSQQSGSSRSTRRANHKKKLVKEKGESGPYYTSSDSDIHRARSRALAERNEAKPTVVSQDQKQKKRKGLRKLLDRMGI